MLCHILHQQFFNDNATSEGFSGSTLIATFRPSMISIAEYLAGTITQPARAYWKILLGFMYLTVGIDLG